MRRDWILLAGLFLVGCSQEEVYQPTPGDYDKMSRLESANAQGDGVWDDTNYQWEIQDLRNGGARAAAEETAPDAPLQDHEKRVTAPVSSDGIESGLPQTRESDGTHGGATSKATQGRPAPVERPPGPGLLENLEEADQPISS